MALCHAFLNGKEGLGIPGHWGFSLLKKKIFDTHWSKIILNFSNDKNLQNLAPACSSSSKNSVPRRPWCWTLLEHVSLFFLCFFCQDYIPPSSTLWSLWSAFWLSYREPFLTASHTLLTAAPALLHKIYVSGGRLPRRLQGPSEEQLCLTHIWNMPDSQR